MQPAEEARRIYEQAAAYDEAGDVYNATKLYKRVIRLDPEWPSPYFRLLGIYKRRREWKPAYHYAKRSLALDPSPPGAWWDLGIAATALKKWGIAKNVWSKFDAPASFPKSYKGIVSIPLRQDDQMELIWARPLCPARAEIISIPRPELRQRYRDIILYDRQQRLGHNVTGNRKLPVYEYLGHWKHSHYRTFSCWIYTTEEKDVLSLEQLCLDAGFGFENWSNSTLNMAPKKLEKQPEFYNFKADCDEPAAAQWIAVAAHRQREVEGLLRHWHLISLKEYGELQCHG